MELLNNFSQIITESPADKIIRQIRDLITSGHLNPGDKLPSERKLSERLGVGRTPLRDAIKKLEFYGILKTLPQNGTIVNGIGLSALEGLITDVLGLEDNDFKSLVETRVILEINSAKLAAKNRTEEDIYEIESALNLHKNKILNDDDAVEEDLLFHLKIAEASKNTVLKSLMLIITPDILLNFKEFNVCGKERSNAAIDHHQVILEKIKNKDVDSAGTVMSAHLKEILDYSRNYKSINSETLKYENKRTSYKKSGLTIS